MALERQIKKVNVVEKTTTKIYYISTTKLLQKF